MPKGCVLAWPFDVPMMSIKPTEAAAPRRVLPVLVMAQLAGTSPWFAVNAVMPELQAEYGFGAAAVGTLSAAMQAGFIAGTLVFALLAVADRVSPRRVFLACALLAALCTLAAVAAASSMPALLAWRALTGFCIAGIYPVGMKIASQWFPGGLGHALGWLVGALVIGSASPHLMRAVGADFDWRAVFVCVAAVTAGGGLLLMLALPEPPHVARPAGLRLGALAALWRHRLVRASVLGYFGHMWELYTVWVLVPIVLATRLAGAATVSAWAFGVLGVGALGCVAGGLLARRHGSARVAAVQLAISGMCCLAAPWLLAAPLPIFLAWLLVWGVTVAGDSPQFSAMTAGNAPRESVGSVLTLTNCIGFSISAISVAGFVHLAQSWPLAELLPWLAIGPLLGLVALRPLLTGAR